MATKESVGGYTLIRTPKGRLRVDIPATTLEADDIASLVDQLEKRLVAVAASLEAIRNDIQEAEYRVIEQTALRGDALAKYVEEHPAPPEWFAEPEWQDDATE